MSKKILSLLLALLFVVASLSGCTAKDSSSDKDAANGEPSEINFDEEPYTINFLYLVAMEGTDQQKVNDAVNELTLKGQHDPHDLRNLYVSAAPDAFLRRRSGHFPGDG